MRVEGLSELKTALRELPDATAKSVLLRIGRARLARIVEVARSMVPVLSGRLKKSLAVSTRLSRRQRAQHRKQGDDVEVFGGASALPHAHLVEFGSVHNQARPFMGPAWEATKDGLLKNITADLWHEIDKAAMRLAKKAAKAGK